MQTYLVVATTDEAQLLLSDIEAVELRANALGLYPAARALNNAKNAAGWQIAGNIAEADRASTWRA